MQGKTPQAFWDAGIEAMSTFAKREGHSNVPANHREGVIGLGSWVIRKRRYYRDGLLSAAQIQQLESFPGWEWERVTVAAPKHHQAFWDVRIAALTAFAEREGHSDVPYRHREGDVDLGAWVKHKRGSYRKGILSSHQIDELEAFPGWEWQRTSMPVNRAHQNNWEAGVAALAKFAAREGHCSVPRKHREDGVGLGYWVDSKRKNYRNGILSAEQIVQLEAFPSWDWGPYDDRWWPDYEIFKAHVLNGGSSSPQKGTFAGGIDLFAWYKQQQSRHRIGNLSAEATAALEAVPGWMWSAYSETELRRESAVSSYRRFVSREKHGSVPGGHVEAGFKLGLYLCSARWREGAGQGVEEQTRALDAVSSDWRETPAARATTALQEKTRSRFQRFVDREGHGVVSLRHVEWGFPLGQALSQKRRALRRGSLSEQFQELLDPVSPDWRSAPEPVWDPNGARTKTAAAYRVFVAREGHGQVPYKHIEGGVAIGKYLSERRGKLACKQLGENTQRVLDSVSTDWREYPARQLTSTATQEEASASYRRFLEREGHGFVARAHVEDGFFLGSYLAGSRAKLAGGKLSARTEDLLDAINADWRVSPSSAKRDKAAAAYRRFVAREGHGVVGCAHVEDGFPLGRRLSSSRGALNTGNPSPDRFKLIDAVSTDWRLPLKTTTYPKAA